MRERKKYILSIFYFSLQVKIETYNPTKIYLDTIISLVGHRAWNMKYMKLFKMDAFCLCGCQRDNVIDMNLSHGCYHLHQFIEFHCKGYGQKISIYRRRKSAAFCNPNCQQFGEEFISIAVPTLKATTRRCTANLQQMSISSTQQMIMMIIIMIYKSGCSVHLLHNNLCCITSRLA